MSGTNILTPACRLVGGHPMEEQTTDATGAVLRTKTGPNAGQPKTEWYVAVAISKTAPEWSQIWGDIHKEARAGFPNLFDAAGNCTKPDFAFKVVDGDSQVPNLKDVKPCDREGYPGNWVVSFKTGIQPKCFDQNNLQILDKNLIKRGFWVQISGAVVNNGSSVNPGVFMNFNMLKLVGYDEEIHVGPDANQVFGGAPVELPARASAAPLANAPQGGAPAPAPGRASRWCGGDSRRSPRAAARRAML